jgi:putative ABC transport system ATP-binding protein
MIVMENIRKAYPGREGAVEVLNGVNLRIRPGSYAALTGPSGSGKSTLMHILGCLDTPTSGRYLLDGQDVSRMSQAELCGVRREKIGFVFQGYQLMTKLNALENAAFPLLLRGVAERERMEAAAQALHRVGLAGREHHRPGEMSGGQQQRVALARALCAKPKLLLCDEPTGALDYQTGKAILKLLQDTGRETGMTIIIITHNGALTDMADRVIQVRNGTVRSVTLNPNPKDIAEIEW